jgi:hypothetical protein
MEYAPLSISRATIGFVHVNGSFGCFFERRFPQKLFVHVIDNGCVKGSFSLECRSIKICIHQLHIGDIERDCRLATGQT